MIKRAFIQGVLGTLTAAACGGVLAQGTPQADCDENGIAVGFFNGVQTTPDEAQNVLRVLTRIYTTTSPKGEPVEYELFYNHSKGLSDFVETFEQRLKEQNGLLAGRFELFFSSLKGGGDWWTNITRTIASASGILKGLIDSVQANFFNLFAKIGPSADPSQDYLRHNAQIDRLLMANKKLLLVAHSQGNLFVNAAYQHALRQAKPEAVKVVHIAPASPVSNGGHTLADLDLVINGLRLVGSVLGVTDRVEGYAVRPPGLNGERDILGHGLLEIYLNPALPTRARVDEQVFAALNALQSEPRQSWPDYPEFVPGVWTGGDAPVVLPGRVDRSHQIEKLVLRSSVPFRFEKRHSSWVQLQSVGGSGSGNSRVEFIGPGMGGSQVCTWAPAPSGLGFESWVECRFDRVPERYLVTGLADELEAQKDAQAGTVLSLSTLTYSNKVRIEVDDFGTPRQAVKLFSGVIPWSFVELQGRRTWSEAYTETQGSAQNQEAYDTWYRQRNAFEVEERVRRGRYDEDRLEYERRRRLCAAPPPPPPPPSGCEPSDVGDGSCPS